MRENRARAITQGIKYVGERGVCLEEGPMLEEEEEEKN